MKIVVENYKQTKIREAVNPVSIPRPFNKYYKIISDSKIESEFGIQSRPSPFEELNDYSYGGYEGEHIAYAVPRSKYYDDLSNDGLDLVEVISDEDGNIMLGYVVNDRLYQVDESDMPGDNW